MRRSLLLAAGLQLVLATGGSCSTSLVTREGLLKLSDADWQSSVSKGAWLIEFFSSKTKSSDFLPTWEQLVKYKASLSTDYPNAPFNFAQVDCSISTDLCVGEGITETPRLFTYVEGSKSKTQYQGKREYLDLVSYVDREAAAFRKLKGVSDEPHPLPSSKPATSAKSPAAGDAAGASPAAPPPPAPTAPIGPVSPNQAGTLTKFGSPPIPDDAALERFLSKESRQGPSFVKFFAPWCPHCKAMAPAYQKLSETLKGKVNVIEVDCVAHRETCVKYGVQSFPTLRMFNNGRATEYRGGRSHEAMLEWAIKAGSNSGLKEIGHDDIERIAKDHDVYFLYLFSPETPQREQDIVEEASSFLMSKQTYAFRTSDATLIQRYASYLHVSKSSSPASAGAQSGLLVFKDHNHEVPVSRFYPSSISSTLSDEKAVQQVAAWLNAERFPTVSELIGTTFADVIYNDAKALVVLAALSDVHHGGNVVGTGSGSEERALELKLFEKLARKWRSSSHPKVKEKILFAWIDADRWATAIKTYYKIRPVDVPQVVLVEGSRLQYYELPSDSPAAARGRPWLDEASLFHGIEAVSQGRVRAKSSKTYIDRGFEVAGGAVASIVVTVSRHPWLSLALLVVFAAAFFSFLRRVAANTQKDRQPLLPTASNCKLD
ncbi:thioredoxin-domain-containing protein [Tilletiaria anomala UBC 951]|uniref:Thioredoxin-domain-containing protein n=1 Tax=Tilletiaria anomala (strain ATCC 24038 / CBS 436.72 / UBC 951) TaxID=1037660 RepID=A0A066W2L2_TILAU|nr:thioredoxin-domain-containing protein [Tilletiaria anomala UBC 951]KDN48212.1 thioredoxin-domain-containing protein [Tilletiaria anomala UBC 951]